ncbi:MAG: HAD family hydrolase [Acidimicrobiia bacterium]|nr:HAD family hydrolase [Acidimicrobiia bacterium]
MSGLSPIRAVVFDLFHTLVDPEDFRPRDFDRGERIAAVLGVDPVAFRGHWEGQLAELVACPDRPADRAVAYAVSRGMPVTPAQYEEVDDILGRYQDLALEHPRPEILAALGELRSRGLRLGLLSNAHERDVRSWGRSPLQSLLDVACFSCFLGAAKPDSAAYRAVLAALGADAGSAAFVADGGGGELAGARRHGFGLVVLVSGLARRSGLRTDAEVAALEPDADLHLAGVEDMPAWLAAE